MWISTLIRPQHALLENTRVSLPSGSQSETERQKPPLGVISHIVFMVKYFPPDLGQGLGKGRSAGDRSGSREGGMEWRRPRRFRSSSEVWVSGRKEHGGGETGCSCQWACGKEGVWGPCPSSGHSRLSQVNRLFNVITASQLNVFFKGHRISNSYSWGTLGCHLGLPPPMVGISTSRF